MPTIGIVPARIAVGIMSWVVVGPRSEEPPVAQHGPRHSGRVERLRLKRPNRFCQRSNRRRSIEMQRSFFVCKSVTER